MQEKSIVETYTRDTEEMKSVLVKLQGDYEKVLGQGHVIEEARETLHTNDERHK